MGSSNRTILGAFFFLAATTILAVHSQGQQITSSRPEARSIVAREFSIPDQKPPTQPALGTEQDHRIRVAVDVVSVEVAVTDARGNYLRDLKRENFRVLEDGEERAITNFAASEAPALVLVLVETSTAVYLIQQQHLGAARTLLEGLGANDWVALAAYDSSPRVLQIFTQRKEEVLFGLMGMHYDLGTSDLYFFSSLSTALDWLDPIPGRKSLVVLTTGLDTQRPRQWEALAEKLRSSEVVVYPIALGGSLREFRNAKKAETEEGTNLSFAQADRDLKEMARLTGGRAYFPKRVQDFSGIYRELSSAVRLQYSLGFPPAARDGLFHKIEVQVVDAKGRVLAPAENQKRGYRIRARQGYVATKQ